MGRTAGLSRRQREEAAARASSPERPTSPPPPAPSSPKSSRLPSTRFLKAYCETAPENCHVHGDGLTKATVRQPATFTIESYDEDNERRGTGGDAFFIAVRGGSKVRARLTDNNDGTYVVKYCPSVSGKYTIAISLFGVSLPGSPWNLEVISPQPMAEMCELKGDALKTVIARTPSAFEVRYKDAFGCTATAEDLDVFVERRPPGEGEKVPEPPPPPPAPPKETSSQILPRHLQGGKGDLVASAPAPAPAALEVDVSAGDGSGGEDGGDGDGADGDGGGTKSRRGDKIPKEKSHLKQRVEVGQKPLVVRSGFNTTSEHVGTLPKGVLMTVLEERLTPEGDVRARISLVEEKEGIEQVAEGWWRPFQFTHGEVSLMDEGPIMLLTMKDDGVVRAPAASGSLPSSPEKKDTATGGSSPSKQRGNKSVRFGGGGGDGGDDSPEMKQTQQREVIEEASPEGPSKPMVKRASSSPAVMKTTRSGNKTSRGGVPAHGVVNQGKKGAGWVTLVKSGSSLVRLRERLNAGQRQAYLEQWQRRQRADKTVAAATATNNKKGDDRDKDGNKKKKIKSVDLLQGRNIYAHELEVDIEQIGFAYGGVEPGVLHAKGQLHEVHRCTYSVGKAGTYWLHVRLRNQALSIPGSPFALLVKPDKPHAQSTKLPEGVQPLNGVVGDKHSDGCHVVLRTADKMGNECNAGGATVVVTCSNKDVKTSCEDNGDGSYNLAWRSRYCGTSEVSVQIQGVHIKGSPCPLTLRSTQPDLYKTTIDGEGITKAHAGKDAKFNIYFVDGYNNVSTPGSTYALDCA